MNYNDEKSQMVTQFLNEIRTLKLTGREFLALIGNTKISNSSYYEIKDNPQLTYERLVEIFYESPLTVEDYARIVKSAKEYNQSKQGSKRQRQEEELKNAVSVAEKRLEQQRILETLSINKLKTAPLQDRTAPFQISAESTRPIDGFYSEPPEKSFSRAEFAENSRAPDRRKQLDDYGSLTGETDSYTGSIQDITNSGYYDIGEAQDDYEDETENIPESSGFKKPVAADKHRSDYSTDDAYLYEQEGGNTGKLIIAAVLAVTLIILSFFIRYYNTGSILIIDENKIMYAPAESYQDLAARFMEMNSGINEVTAFEGGYYLIPKKADISTELCSNDKYIFRIYDNILYVLQINKGRINAKGMISRDDKTFESIFLHDDKLYAVMSGEYTSRYHDDNPIGESADGTALPASEGNFTQSTITVLVFDALQFSEQPINEITVDGAYNDIVINKEYVFLVTDYQIKDPAAHNDFAAYIPSFISLGGEKRNVKFENIYLPESKVNYSNMTVVTRFSANGEVMTKACVGGRASWLYASGQSLYLIQQGDDKSRIIKYDNSESNFSVNGYFDVEGTVYKDGMEVRNAIIRISAVSEKGTMLYLYYESLQKISVIENISPGSTPKNVLFDDTYAYIVTDTLYAADISKADNPVLVESGFAQVYSDDYLVWSENYRLSLNSNDNGELYLSMYQLSDGNIIETAATPITQDDSFEGGKLVSEALTNRNSLYYSADSSLIVIPLTYFNGISQIEKFVAYTYSEDTGFSNKGEIVYYDWNKNNHSSVAEDGYIYTFWDDVVVSAEISDMYVIEQMLMA